MRPAPLRRLSVMVPRSVLRPALASLFVLLWIGHGLAQSQNAYNWYVVLEVDAPTATRASVMSDAIDRLKRRLRSLRFGSFQIEAQGGPDSNRILVQLPTAADPERVKQVLVSEAQLEIRPVISAPEPDFTTYATDEDARKAAGPSDEVFPYTLSDAELRDAKVRSKNRFLILGSTPVFAGSDIRSASVHNLSGLESDNGIYFDLRDEGASRMLRWTRTHIKSYLAVVHNGNIKSVIFIRGEIGRGGVIEGKFTRKEAEDLAAMLNGGPLPAKVKIVTERSYDTPPAA